MQNPLAIAGPPFEVRTRDGELVGRLPRSISEPLARLRRSGPVRFEKVELQGARDAAQVELIDAEKADTQISTLESQGGGMLVTFGITGDEFLQQHEDLRALGEETQGSAHVRHSDHNT